jgi:crotonobetainyl-CoA:carnitine CoA-transferase CaiB-like acyl-CoA transferase
MNILDGLKVVDCTQILAGPFCTMMLGDMGAEITKVEKPNGGDDIRRFGPPFIDGESAAFLMINRNKKSIALNMKDPKGLKILKELIKDADVFIQNFRPGALEKMGLGFDDVIKNINPKIIYCSISGFGSTGPYKNRPGFDLIAQGMSGLMSLTGTPNGEPVKIGVPICDLNAGVYAALGILASYIKRLKTNKGQFVETSLLESGLSYTIWESGIYFATKEVSKQSGTAHRLSAPYQSFKTSDGYINIGAANQANWEKLCSALKRTDLKENKEFIDNASRMNNIKKLVDILNVEFTNKTTSEWVEILIENGVPCGPILNIDEILNHDQIKEREMIIDINHTKLGKIQNLNFPIKFSDSEKRTILPPPLLGEHNEMILKDLGYSKDDIRLFEKENVITS